MKFSIAYDPGIPCFVAHLSGVLTIQELEACFQEILNDPNWRTDLPIVWDTRKCSYEGLKPHSADELAVIADRYRKKRGKGKSACVVSRDFDFGMARMFELSSQRSIPADFQVFRDLSEALAWIGSERQKTGKEDRG